MKYIYLKGLLKKKMLIIMSISIFIFLLSLFFLFGYTNVINAKIYNIESEIESRTVYIHYKNFDIDKYKDIIEEYSNYDEDFYELIFINYEESRKFIEENADKVSISNDVKSYNEKELIFYRILKIVSYVLPVFFLVAIIAFQIHYINNSKKEIELYNILGLSIRKIMYLFNLFFSLFFVILSVFIYIITYLINPNILISENLLLIIAIFVLAFGIVSVITNRLYIKDKL